MNHHFYNSISYVIFSLLKLSSNSYSNVKKYIVIHCFCGCYCYYYYEKGMLNWIIKSRYNLRITEQYIIPLSKIWNNTSYTTIALMMCRAIMYYLPAAHISSACCREIVKHLQVADVVHVSVMAQVNNNMDDIIVCQCFLSHSAITCSIVTE